MAKPRKSQEDRLFNPKGLKHFRRRHSVGEFRLGLMVPVVLLAIVSWVAYRGAHPDPDLFSDGADLLKRSKKPLVAKPPATITRPRVPSGPANEADKLLPPELADKEWKKKASSSFDKKTLYVKINGREAYFKSFGFKQLFATTLLHRTAPHSIDIELYDLGSSANALGAYTGELGPKARPEVGARGMHHLARNALFVARGRYYLRMIGSDENSLTKNKLIELRGFFQKRIKGVPLPWGFGFFVGQLKLKANTISYLPSNAFSFAFGKDVYTAKLGKGSYLFICAQQNPGAAQTLSAQFLKGWLSYGSKVTAPDKIGWVKDRYINTLSTALAVDRWVVGVQGATDLKLGQPALQRLKKAVLSMGADLKKRAVPKQQPPQKKGGVDEQ